MSPGRAFHIALQFGHIQHFNEGLAEFSRQLAGQLAGQARQLSESRDVHFHFILPRQWHGLFGEQVTYHELTDAMRLRHRFAVDLDVWHGLHQHMRYRPPVNSRRNIITVHDLNHVYAKRGLSLWWQNLRLTRHLRRAHQLVAISQFVADDIRRCLPWAPPVAVIHNGVADLSRVTGEPPPGVVPDGYLLHISRMSASKNVGSLIEMMAVWPEQSLLLVGPDSPEVARHREHVARLKLGNVFFMTDVTEPQKAWLLAHCRAFVFPSKFEGFGLPPVEAMQFGKPVMVSPNTSLPEVCGEAAGYWSGDEPQLMRRELESHLARHVGSADAAERIRAHAARYNWPAAAARYQACYGIEGTPC